MGERLAGEHLDGLLGTCFRCAAIRFTLSFIHVLIVSVSLAEKPTIDAWTDSSLRDLPPLPDEAIVTRFLNTVLLLHITSTKHYSAHARAFLLAFSSGTLDEAAATHTLKNPKEALKDAEKHAEDAKNKQAKSNKVWRAVGMGSAAVVGGVLVGVTGGLAAPLVGAGISTVFGILGVGGSAAGVLAAGLAGSSAVCGCLFGAYGAKSGYQMISEFLFFWSFPRRLIRA